MRLILGIFLFCLFFLLGSCGVHYLIYDRPGLFIWSIKEGVVTKTKTSITPQKSRNMVATETVEEKNPNIFKLFDGKSLGQWEVSEFGGEGAVIVDDEGNLDLSYGEVMTGVHWKGNPPRTSNYEIRLEAMKLDGSDFFCGLTFPVKDSHATLIVGGWGDTMIGISSIDGLDAMENETLKVASFDSDVWYHIKLRVSDDKIQVWIDGEQQIDVNINNREISLRPGPIEISAPIGIACFQTSAKYRNIIWENLSEKK